MKVAERKQLYKDLFTSRTGELVLKDLKKRYHMDTTTFHPDLNAMALANREGHRDVILDILNLIKTK